MISVLIDHPTEGLLLYETGAGKDYPEVWQVSTSLLRHQHTARHKVPPSCRASKNQTAQSQEPGQLTAARGQPLNDIFARVKYRPEQELDATIAACGRNIKDVKGVIMGHLHLDHASGLGHFAGTDVPIYVHEAELKHAFYSVATKSDIGACAPLTP